MSRSTTSAVAVRDSCTHTICLPDLCATADNQRPTNVVFPDPTGPTTVVNGTRSNQSVSSGNGSATSMCRVADSTSANTAVRAVTEEAASLTVLASPMA